MAKKSKKQTNEIIIYSNETCPYCKQVKEKLVEKEIKFEDRATVDFQKEWANIIGLTGMSQIPTILYKNSYFIPGRDFQNVEHLLDIIDKYQGENPDQPADRYVLERVKTLNYNIYTAFNKLEQTLKNIELKLDKLNTKENVDKSTD